jgi:cytochrome P450
MFAAGTDTTTTAMEWAMAELITHPRAMRRAQDHVAQLDYLKAVVKETLRLHAPVLLLVPREPAADAEILGFHVPARTRVLVNAWAIGRDPATWERA